MRGLGEMSMNGNKIYNVAILGLGAIFNRHLLAIQFNSQNFNIVGLYDPKSKLLNQYASELNCKAYKSEDEVYNDVNVNCVIILTPSNLHFTQTMRAISAAKNVIVEKPAVFLANQLDLIINNAIEHAVNVFTVLQVRLNPAVLIAKELIVTGMLGDLNGVSLVQRWQRPFSYFTGWRGNMQDSGGILREFGIHYLDVMQFLVGLPRTKCATFYTNKFKNTDVADTIYALFDFGGFGGSAEVSIACEPHNLECSLVIRGSNGVIKLGGKSLDEIVTLDLLDMNEQLAKIEQIKASVATTNTATKATQGASPYHPELYRQIIQNPERFAISATYNVVKLIQGIYEFEQSK
jgi:UDP-N-acetyl-2-amino-2-deoxyglucuronate dehydrogenase